MFPNQTGLRIYSGSAGQRLCPHNKKTKLRQITVRSKDSIRKDNDKCVFVTYIYRNGKLWRLAEE